ncbi:MAG: ABC transporter ATP-binding protein [Candidatus Phosphoribacter sp.]
MTESLVEIRDLTKTFGRGARRAGPAVDGLSLDVSPGGIFGLLGPNGSGKTTTLRMLFGLVRPDAGSIRVLGRSVPHHLWEVAPQMGALIDGPRLLPNMTGRRNLELLAAIRSIAPNRIDEVLELVALAHRAGDQVRTYSHGMRQRLALAAAILGRPRLLVLDEPSNGLDPAGMSQMRAFITQLAQQGDVTVVLSSHLLSEVEQVCDRVAILNQGRLVSSGPLKEILSSAASGPWVRVRCEDPVRAAAILTAFGCTVEGVAGGIRVAGSDQREVLSRLLDGGLTVQGVSEDQRTLEEAFLTATGEST